MHLAHCGPGINEDYKTWNWKGNLELKISLRP